MNNGLRFYQKVPKEEEPVKDSMWKKDLGGPTFGTQTSVQEVLNSGALTAQDLEPMMEDEMYFFNPLNENLELRWSLVMKLASRLSRPCDLRLWAPDSLHSGRLDRT
jgi:hypothetical protein